MTSREYKRGRREREGREVLAPELPDNGVIIWKVEISCLLASLKVDSVERKTALACLQQPGVQNAKATRNASRGAHAGAGRATRERSARAGGLRAALRWEGPRPITPSSFAGGFPTWQAARVRGIRFLRPVGIPRRGCLRQNRSHPKDPGFWRADGPQEGGALFRRGRPLPPKAPGGRGPNTCGTERVGRRRSLQSRAEGRGAFPTSDRHPEAAKLRQRSTSFETRRSGASSEHQNRRFRRVTRASTAPTPGAATDRRVAAPAPGGGLRREVLAVPAQQPEQRLGRVGLRLGPEVPRCAETRRAGSRPTDGRLKSCSHFQSTRGPSH